VFGFLERSARSEPWWCDLFNGSGFRPGVGVKAVRNVVGILRVLGSCHVRTRSAEEWNPMV